MYNLTDINAPIQRQHQTKTPLNTRKTPDPTCQVSPQAPTVTSTENINQEEMVEEYVQVENDVFINIFCTPVQVRGETSNIWHGNRLLYHEGRNVHGRKSVPGMNSSEREMERGKVSLMLEILSRRLFLKLNLSDHRSILIDLQEILKGKWRYLIPAKPPIHNHVLIPNYQDFKIQDFRYFDGFECFQAIKIE
nr:hypothetical protein [Tanacetum cinerariifolium]